VKKSSLPGTLDGWLTLLEARHPKAIDLGLERCGQVWQQMGSPRAAQQTFVVAGTNGKGSTVATLCSLLSSLGYSQGSYTSPHLIRYNERVRINGRAASDEEMMRAFERVEAARGDVSLSYFEFGTLAAISMLSRRKLDFAVMEVGLGGRLDAVNLLDADCAVITPVGFDHQEYLGSDLDSIGREKAGIIRPACPVVCGEPEPPASIRDHAASLQAPLMRLGVEFSAKRAGAGFRFRMNKIDLLLPAPVLEGAHQVNNAAVALAALLQLLPAASEDVAALYSGMATVKLSGRLERVREDPAVWIDVGHNPMAAQAVAATLQRMLKAGDIRSCRCVLGMLEDKDVAAVATELEPLISGWYCAGIGSDRGQNGQQLAGRIGAVIAAPRIRSYDNVDSALNAALSDCAPGDGLLVFGSFLTAADAVMALRPEGPTTGPR